MIKPLSFLDKISVRRFAKKVAKGMKNCSSDLNMYQKYDLVMEQLKTKNPNLLDKYYNKIYVKNEHEASYYYEQAFRKIWYA